MRPGAAGVSRRKIPVVYTSRVLFKLEDGSKMDNLKLSARISQRFTEFVDHLDITPGFFVAKGGITSSDMATRACRIRKAQVMGQALAGIPVIQAALAGYAVHHLSRQRRG